MMMMLFVRSETIHKIKIQTDFDHNLIVYLNFKLLKLAKSVLARIFSQSFK